MDNKKKMKKLAIILCIIGAVMLLSGGYIILRQNVSPSKKEATANATTDTEELVTEDSNSADDSEQNTKKQQSAHEINPDVYEWPCGKKDFATMEEPEDIIYFAKNKEKFDEVVKEFSQYEGKEVLFSIGMSSGELLEANNGEVEVKGYDLECIRKLLQDEYIKAIHVSDISIEFAIKNNDFNNIIYSFDDEIDPFSKANIAPHWWWRTGVGD